MSLPKRHFLVAPKAVACFETVHIAGVENPAVEDKFAEGFEGFTHEFSTVTVACRSGYAKRR